MGRNVDKDGFYKTLRAKVDAWLKSKTGKHHKHARYILLAPDLFHLVSRLITEPKVPIELKAILGFALAYFVLPTDLLPEGFIGPAGYMEDIILTVWVLNRLINKTGPHIVQKYWAGEEDLLLVLKNITAKADKLVGSGILKTIKRLLGGKR
ncbi:MAG: DUF1232 domain-containing protein [Ignavibacteriae bacterium]|nr:DUF1232 domain-containing protein [Ignavibacteriota bacterium]